ncbi:hypothetical protein C6502_19465 [Candidatus Poribacteria bacterium]|nr:MAG: hypothetical protein C6502_19465 [Candidatus Poribacteria bacterium]
MGIRRHFRSTLITGILTLIPLGVTVFVLKFLFTTIDGWLKPIMSPILSEVLDEKFHIGMGVLAMILLVYLVGLVVSNFLGQKLLGAGEKILTRIPLVREVYAPVKQVVQMALMTSNASRFSRAVAIKTPGSTIRVIGFVTGEFHEEGNPVPVSSVFVPTSPNPTTGVLLFCDPEIIYETNMKVETAMKMLISGGIVAPDDFTIRQQMQQQINPNHKSE